MESIEVSNIRSALAELLASFGAQAHHYRECPSQITVEALKSATAKCICTAHFCMTIRAIDGDSYRLIRDAITQLTSDVCALRASLRAKHGTGGYCAAISKGVSRLVTHIAALREGSEPSIAF